MMDDEPERMDPRCDDGGRGYMLWMEYCSYGEYVRATDYDALVAKLAKVEADRDHWEAVAWNTRPDKAEARIAHLENHIEAVAKDTHKIMVDLATPMRCAECDCEKGGADCNWIATPAPAVKPKPTDCEWCVGGMQADGETPCPCQEPADPLRDLRLKALVGLLQRARQEMRLIRMKDSGAVYDVLLRTEIDAALSALEENK